MKAYFAVIIGLAALFTACDRRPVQKDIVLDGNTMQQKKAAYSEMQSSPGAASAPFELQFLDALITNHEAAIDMALLVETRAQHAELKAFAKSSLTELRNEVAELRKLRNGAYPGKDIVINMDFPGLRNGMKQIDLAKLDMLKENAFDLEFIKQMVQLDLGTVQMVKNAATTDLVKPVDGRSASGADGAVGPEVKTLAAAILKARDAEITQMRGWQNAWDKENPAGPAANK